MVTVGSIFSPMSASGPATSRRLACGHGQPRRNEDGRDDEEQSLGEGEPCDVAGPAPRDRSSAVSTRR